MEVLVYNFELDTETTFMATFILFFSIMGVGFQASQIPSISLAKSSAKPVFAIIDEPSSLDVRKCTDRPLKQVGDG